MVQPNDVQAGSELAGYYKDRVRKLREDASKDPDFNDEKGAEIALTLANGLSKLIAARTAFRKAEVEIRKARREAESQKPPPPENDPLEAIKKVGGDG